jgi:predicted RNA-binding protein with PUA-like domain
MTIGAASCARFDDARWECVDIRAVGAFPRPLRLDLCKAEPPLKDMVLVTTRGCSCSQ